MPRRRGERQRQGDRDSGAGLGVRAALRPYQQAPGDPAGHRPEGGTGQDVPAQDAAEPLGERFAGGMGEQQQRQHDEQHGQPVVGAAFRSQEMAQTRRQHLLGQPTAGDGARDHGIGRYQRRAEQHRRQERLVEQQQREGGAGRRPRGAMAHPNARRHLLSPLPRLAQRPGRAARHRARRRAGRPHRAHPGRHHRPRRLPRHGRVLRRRAVQGPACDAGPQRPGAAGRHPDHDPRPTVNLDRIGDRQIFQQQAQKADKYWQQHLPG